MKMQAGTASNGMTVDFEPISESLTHSPADSYVQGVIHNTIVEILRSYHQTYDHLQELIQNAIDTCEDTYDEYTGRNEKFKPLIKVLFDLDNNRITVTDNGMGMNEEILKKYYFTPFSGMKTGPIGKKRRGEKGVGATFLSYGSHKITISTKPIHGSGAFFSCELSGGVDWVKDASGLIPMPKVRPCAPPPELIGMDHGTIITIELNNLTNLKNLDRHGRSVEDWGAILSLFTSIGFICIGDDGPEPTNFLKALVVDVTVVESGLRKSGTIDTGYLYPHLVDNITSVQLRKIKRTGAKSRPTGVCSMKDLVIDWYGDVRLKGILMDKLNNPRQTRFISNKDNMIKAIEFQKPRAYVAFTYSNEFWSAANKAIFKTARSELSQGIIFATKTHRVGSAVGIEFTYSTTDFNRFSIVIDMDGVPPDIGRKSIPQDACDIAQLIADAIHESFRENKDCLKPSPSSAPAAGLRLLDDIRHLAVDDGEALDSTDKLGLRIAKVPREEQDVIALFFELLGKDYLHGYRIYATHISEKYDAVAEFELAKNGRYLYDSVANRIGIPEAIFDEFTSETVLSPRRQFLEFKTNSDELISNIESEEKQLREMHWLVCWEIGTKARRLGIDIIDVTDPSQINHRVYYGQTHLMIDGEGSKVHVIALKQVVENLINGTGGI